MTRVTIDLETRSAADLRKCGAAVYAEHPSTCITHVGFRIEGQETRVWRPLGGSPCPLDLLLLLENPRVTLVAHNFEFERTLLTSHAGESLGLPTDALRVLDRWDCTAARAAAMCLPRSLDGASQALGLILKKDAEGHRLMLQVCKPRRPRKDEDEDAGQARWWDDEPRMLRMDQYCMRDVDVECVLDSTLAPLRPEERAAWHTTVRMNERGVKIDEALVAVVTKMIDAVSVSLNREIAAVTDGCVSATTDARGLTAWLTAQGVSGHVSEGGKASIAKDIVIALLDQGNLTPVVRRVLGLRQEGSKASVAKWKAMLNRRSADGRAHGSLLYCGAVATARWSSQGIQLQNLPRGGTIPGVLDAAEWLLANAHLPGEALVTYIAVMFGPPTIVASELLRPALIAEVS